MLTLTSQILDSFAKETIEAIRAKIPNVTGTMSNSLQYRIDESGLTIYSTEKYFTVLETGRSPTKNKTASPNGTLRDVIHKWIIDKGIIPDGGISTKSLAFLITRKIHAEGTQLFRDGGNSGVISDAINEQIVKEKVIDRISISFRDYVINEFINKR
jgi:hypothetical protein